MMRGTRVGLIENPERTSTVTCWRCGIRFDHDRQNVGRTDPCRDCRSVLRAEGDDTVWDTRKKGRAA